MKEYLKIAWRNLWRNRRRTAITSASILFAVFFALIMRSFQLGLYNHMIKNAVESYSGFIQIQHKDYQDEPSLENTFPYNKELLNKLETIEEAKAIVPRVETFALASSGPKTKAAMVVGIVPDKEKGVSDPSKKLVKYYFSEKVIDNLKLNTSLPDEVKEKLDEIKEKSYAVGKNILSDLQLKEKGSEEILATLKTAGKYPGTSLGKRDSGVLVSSRLAKYLKLTVGDTLVLLGQGYRGATAADLFPIRGIVKFPNPDLDNKLVYMTLERAQYFTDLGENVTSIAINLYDNKDKNMLKTQHRLNELLAEGLTGAKNWKEFNKVLVQQIEGDNQGGKFMLGLLYFIIFFGIIGTVLMMIHERTREFGVLVAIGMQKTRLAVVMLIEMVFIGLLGVLSGIVLSLPFLYSLNKYPIRLRGEMAHMMESYGIEPVLPLLWLDSYVIWQGTVVALMVVLSCIIPLRKVLRLQPVKALKG